MTARHRPLLAIVSWWLRLCPLSCVVVLCVVFCGVCTLQRTRRARWSELTRLWLQHCCQRRMAAATCGSSALPSSPQPPPARRVKATAASDDASCDSTLPSTSPTLPPSLPQKPATAVDTGAAARSTGTASTAASREEDLAGSMQAVLSDPRVCGHGDVGAAESESRWHVASSIAGAVARFLGDDCPPSQYKRVAAKAANATRTTAATTTSADAKDDGDTIDVDSELLDYVY